MKMQVPITRLKSVKNQLKNTRLVVISAVVAVLLVGATSVAAYTMSQQKKSEQETGEVPQKPLGSAPKEEKKAPAVVEEKAAAPTAPANTSSEPSSRAVAPTKPAADRSKPITVQVAWWGGARYYSNQGAQVVSVGSTAVRVVGFTGGELRWQAEANVDGAISVIASGSATIAPNQITYDIPQFDNWGLASANHSSDILVRMHITSPNDTATEWRTITSSDVL